MTRPIKRGYPFPKGLRRQPLQMSARVMLKRWGQAQHALLVVTEELPMVFAAACGELNESIKELTDTAHRLTT